MTVRDLLSVKLAMWLLGLSLVVLGFFSLFSRGHPSCFDDPATYVFSRTSIPLGEIADPGMSIEEVEREWWKEAAGYGNDRLHDRAVRKAIPRWFACVEAQKRWWGDEFTNS